MVTRRRARSAAMRLLLLATLLAPALATADGPRTPPPPGKDVDPAYTEAVKAIDAGQFTRAIPLLEGVVSREPRNADAHNFLGYAVRKNGDAAKSIPIYQKALDIDPKHRGAHEYIGEAYLLTGDLGKAKQHLARLDSLCFFGCSEYRDLKKAIETFEKTGKAPSAGR
jgi:predicted Zn-dependent protease